MGWRFRRRLNIGGGFSLNLGKRGISSISAGKRGAHVTIGRHGVRHTVGLPGTGLSYTVTSGGRKSRGARKVATNHGIFSPLESGEPAPPKIIAARVAGILTRWALIGAILFIFARWFFPNKSPTVVALPTSAPANNAYNQSTVHRPMPVGHHKTHAGAAAAVPPVSSIEPPGAEASPASASPAEAN